MKKGISLITLIITIVVLIILATAVVLALGGNNPVQTAKVASTVETRNSLNEGITMYESSVVTKTLGGYSKKQLLIDSPNYNIVNSTTKTVTESGVEKTLYKIDSAKAKEKLNVQINGEENWYIDENGKVLLVYDNVESIPTYLKDGDNISSSLSNTVTYNGAVAYKVGDSVTINNDGVDEIFYVIKDSSICDLNLTLISKNLIDITNLVQTDNFEDSRTAFSSSRYFLGVSEYTETQNPDGSITILFTEWPNKIKPIYDTDDGLNVDIGNIKATDNKYALYAAQEYGKKLGGKGRLLLLSEVLKLKEINSDLVFGKRSTWKFK